MSTQTNVGIVEGQGQGQSVDEILAEIDRLRAENAKLAAKAQTQARLSLKVSDKGALSVYGLGKWPVTLYREQWLKLLAIADEIKAFIQANGDKLSTKPQK